MFADRQNWADSTDPFQTAAVGKSFNISYVMEQFDSGLYCLLFHLAMCLSGALHHGRTSHF